jgi:flagellar biosynthesis protein FlhF
MLVKTFSGKTAAEALARVREQLGSRACVLETRRRADGVEVVAAAERPGPRLAAPGSPLAPASSTAAAGAERLRDDLVAWGFSLPFADRIAAAAQSNLDAERLEDRIAALSYARELVALWVPASLEPAPPVLALVGPPGVGKTTTLAKLATLELYRGERAVTLASADGRRLGGAEQVESFARILGVPFVPVRDRRELDQARERAGRNAILMLDTPGVPRGDRPAMDRLADLLAGVRREEIELLLAADRDADSLADSVKRFGRLRPGALGATRIDEAVRPGGLLTALARAGLPLRHLGTGPDVPDDIAVADPRRLAAWAVPLPGEPPAPWRGDGAAR